MIRLATVGNLKMRIYSVITSNKLLALSFFISLIIFSSVTRASEQLLAVISSDANLTTYQWEAITSDQDQLLTGFFIDNFDSGSFSSRENMAIKKFISDGLDFGSHKSQKVVTIKGQNFDEEQGGIIVINTLYNAITGRRKYYELQLAKDPTGWKLFYQGKSISRIMAIANRIPLIGVVGAKDLIMK
jgi:hypothetical protein